MQARDILQSKGGALYTVHPDTPLSDCVITMADEDVGSLVVMDGRVRGAWKVRDRHKAARFLPDYWTRVTAAERRDVQEAARRYGRFFGIDLRPLPT